MTGSLSTCQCPHDPLEALMSITACSTSRSTLPSRGYVAYPTSKVFGRASGAALGLKGDPRR